MAGKPKDRTGERYGKVVIKKISERRSKSGGAFWHCLCDCGNWREVDGYVQI